MGVEARYKVSIVKTCDGCGEHWESHQSFSTAGAVLAFGGPVEAVAWEISLTPEGRAQLLCERCAEHSKGASS